MQFCFAFCDWLMFHLWPITGDPHLGLHWVHFKEHNESRVLLKICHFFCRTDRKIYLKEKIFLWWTVVPTNKSFQSTYKPCVTKKWICNKWRNTRALTTRAMETMWYHQQESPPQRYTAAALNWKKRREVMKKHQDGVFIFFTHRQFHSLILCCRRSSPSAPSLPCSVSAVSM